MSKTLPDPREPVVFLDFDNTISLGDVLDSIIERFAVDTRWIELEAAWKAGQLGTRACLDGQMRSLRFTWEELRAHLRGVTLDPAFVPLLALLRARKIEHLIVSDNFTSIIHEILAQQGITGVPVFANHLELTAAGPIPSFPHSNPEHPDCAHCKRIHLLARPHQRTIYVGDGRSDLCPSLIADLVFAKDSLLRALTARNHPCEPITDLAAVLDFFANDRTPLRRMIGTALPTATPLFSAKIPAGRVLAYPSTADIPADQWARFATPHWKDHRFQQLAEETLHEGIEHACLVIQDEAGKTLALQPVFIIRQDLALGTPAFLTRAIQWVRKLWPGFLQPRMIMVGCLAGEGQLVLADDRRDLAVAALSEGIERFARHRKVGLITFKEFPADTRPALQSLLTEGYVRVPSYPSVRMPVAHESFEQHLEHLTAATRKDLRRKFRESAAHGSIQMEIEEHPSAELVDEIHALYLQVFERSEVRFERLTKSYLAQITDVLPDRVRWFLWRYEGRLVAFKLCFVHEGILYDDYIGLDYSVALELHLYFVTFRDLYSWAASYGIREYYSTPLSYDPKLRLGFALAPLDLYVRHTSPILNPLYTRLAKAMGPIAGDEMMPRFPTPTNFKKKYRKPFPSGFYPQIAQRDADFQNS